MAAIAVAARRRRCSTARQSWSSRIRSDSFPLFRSG